MIVRIVEIKGIEFSVIVPAERLPSDCHVDLWQYVLWLSGRQSDQEALESLLLAIQQAYHRLPDHPR